MLEKNQFSRLIAFDPDNPTPSTAYYLDLYRNRTFFSVNPACVAFGPYLFLYHRMYLWFIITMILKWGLTFYISLKYGYDLAMANSFADYGTNFAAAFVFNALFFRFVDKKSRHTNHIGTHVRLFLPLVMFVTYTLGAMLFLIPFGLHFHINWLLTLGQQTIYFSFFYMLFLYVVYFISWIIAKTK